MFIIRLKKLSINIKDKEKSADFVSRTKLEQKDKRDYINIINDNLKKIETNN
jgi:hypothetical protein